MTHFYKGGSELPIGTQCSCPKQTKSNCLKLSILFWGIVMFSMFSLSAQTPRKDSGAEERQQQMLRGAVVSSLDGKPLVGVSVRIPDEKGSAKTDKTGNFTIPVTNRKGKVALSHIGYNDQLVDYQVDIKLNITLFLKENTLDEVEVVSTGFQKIPKERAAGSFEFVDNKLLNRKVSMDFISRLEDVVPSISTVKMLDENRGKFPNINVRGRSSISSNIWPLIVVDGFPYSGNFNNINPNDIENISILKDASASSIWGAQSGNGVIIITTKKAKRNEPFRVSVNANTTVENKPDLYYFPQMNTSDFIDVELMLFEKGFYNSRMYDRMYTLTPVVQLLKDHQEGKLTEAQLTGKINELRSIDMRDDFSKYIYRKAVKQQYNVQLAGGGQKLSNIFSAGFDKNRGAVITSSSDRLSFRNQTTYRPIDRLELNLSTQYTQYTTKDAMVPVKYNEMGAGYGNYPYMRLADENGNPLEVETVGLSRDFRDTVAGGRLLDWNYKPLAELYETQIKDNTKEVMFSFGANYQILPELRLSLLYNFRKADTKQENWRGIGSMHQRDEINYFASWDKQSVKWNYPVGDYLYILNGSSDAQQGRIQLDYNRKFTDAHEVNVLLGGEIRQDHSTAHSSVFFGYDPATLSYQEADLVHDHPYLNGILGIRKINNYPQLSEVTNRFTSYFANASYIFRQRYIFNSSMRKDASNLFGVSANDRGKPFWSIGAAWLLSNESFLTDGPFSTLKLRMTYGKNGNVNNATSAYPIMLRSTQNHFLTALPYASMQSPPNPNLRWETVGMFNLGMDFGLKSGRLSGSAEFYIKTPKDLISATQIDPTTGFASLNVNSANLKAKGIDLSIHSVNVNATDFSWRSDLAFSYNRTKVTKSYLADQLGRYYRSGAYSMNVTPIEGADLNSIISYKWAGLDPETGKPRGYENGEISTNYTSIVNGTLLADMHNSGSALPLYFGSLRNNFTYKNWDCSFNISFQLGHKFMRKSINYSTLLTNHVGHADYAKRWQKPGDEKITDVPVFTYPVNAQEANFYMYSAALVSPADQIKWRDIQIGYSPKNRWLKDLRVYAYAANIMSIWRANKWGIDPEFGNNPPDPLAGSLGLSFSF